MYCWRTLQEQLDTDVQLIRSSSPAPSTLSQSWPYRSEAGLHTRLTFLTKLVLVCCWLPAVRGSRLKAGDREPALTRNKMAAPIRKHECLETSDDGRKRLKSSDDNRKLEEFASWCGAQGIRLSDKVSPPPVPPLLRPLADPGVWRRRYGSVTRFVSWCEARGIRLSDKRSPIPHFLRSLAVPPPPAVCLSLVCTYLPVSGLLSNHRCAHRRSV